MKPQMLLRRTLYKTKDFFQKTLKNLKSFLFGGYQKLPKAPFVNPFFSASNSSRKMQELDDFYRGFSEQWDSLNISAITPSVLMVEDGECSQNHNMNTAEQIIMDNMRIMRRMEENKGKREEACGHSENGGSQSLAQKMKELEMFEVDDVDHQLDIEEVLHYYSRLTCPVYIDIIDKFFMDMYSEFVLPQPSVSVNSSMRRLGPVELLNSTIGGNVFTH
ncbi:hypothetical protein ACH5RR_024509 [Cinchona calisaya]|uniref:OVATE domain-containing protein n=1 Tax=Cinchona calisaya TaxID=153742 RepID=A0ABD2Z031_9GENT